jgi:hypothetical protein
MSGTATMTVEELSLAECWRLLHEGSLGRLAVDGIDGRPNIYPVNFLAHYGRLYFRSAPGGKLRSIAEHPGVAFELDGTDSRFHWSVVVRGDAERMSTDAEIEESGILHLVSTNPTPKHDFVRLTPVEVTGRRFPLDARGAFPRRRDEESDEKDLPVLIELESLDVVVHSAKPEPIPHRTPLPH